MKFTDLFIRRPVLAAVISLLILVVGLRAISACRCCGIRAPRTPWSRWRRPITAPIRRHRGLHHHALGQAIAQANGIDYMTSTSQSGVGTITVYLRLNPIEQGADRDQHQGELGAEPLTAGTQQPVLTVRSARRSTRCISASTAIRSRRTRSRTTSCASCSPSCKP
jgi:multidrug efflux pump